MAGCLLPDATVEPLLSSSEQRVVELPRADLRGDGGSPWLHLMLPCSPNEGGRTLLLHPPAVMVIGSRRLRLPKTSMEGSSVQNRLGS